MFISVISYYRRIVPTHLVGLKQKNNNKKALTHWQQIQGY